MPRNIQIEDSEDRTAEKRIVTTFNGGFAYMFEEIRKEHPEFNSHSAVAQAALRAFYEEVCSGRDSVLREHLTGGMHAAFIA